MSAFNNSDWSGPSAIVGGASSNYSGQTRQARPVGMVQLSDDHAGKPFHVKIFVARSPFRNQQAFGSLTIDTEFGPLTMNGLTIKRNNEKQIITTQSPFKAYPNKREGGFWNIINNEHGQVWQTVGPVNYTKFFDNDAAGVASKLFYEAFCLCSTCKHCQDMDPIIVNRMVDRIAELKSQSERTEEEEAEITELTDKLASMNKTCSLDVNEDDLVWSTEKKGIVETAEEIKILCNRHCKEEIDNSKASIGAASKLFNMSVAVEEPKETDTTEELF